MQAGELPVLCSIHREAVFLPTSLLASDRIFPPRPEALIQRFFPCDGDFGRAQFGVCSDLGTVTAKRASSFGRLAGLKIECSQSGVVTATDFDYYFPSDLNSCASHSKNVRENR